MRFALTMMAVDPPDVFTDLVKYVERGGYESLWLADSSLHAHSVYVWLTLAALNSTRLGLGTNCTHPFTRHPAINLNALCSVDEVSKGRVLIGVGRGDAPVKEVGMREARTDTVVEMVSLFRRLLAGETMTYESDLCRLHNAALHYRHRDRVPIYVTASGPKMIHAAAGVADGIIFWRGVAPIAIRESLDMIREGARAAGRPESAVEAVGNLFGSVSEDGDAACEDVRANVAWGFYRQTYPIRGADPELVEQVRAKVAAGGFGHFHLAREAGRIIPNDVLRKCMLAGTPAQCADQLEQLAAEGLQYVNFFPVGDDRHRSIRLFTEQVMPRFR